MKSYKKYISQNTNNALKGYDNINFSRVTRDILFDFEK